MMNNRFWDTIYRRRVAVVAILVIGLAAVVIGSRFLHMTFEGKASVMMVEQAADKGDSAQKAPDMPEIVMSNAVFEHVKTKLRLPESIHDLQASTKTNIQYQSSVMQIIFDSANRQHATDVPNALADEMASYYRQISAARYDRVTSYLNTELAKERNHVRDLDHKLEVAAAQNSFVGTDHALDRITSALDGLEQKRGEAQAILLSDTASASAAAEAPAAISPVVHQELVGQDPAYRQLRDKVAQDSAQLSAMQAEYTDKYPGLPELRTKVNLERQQLAQAEQRAAAAPRSESPTYSNSVLASNRAQATVAGDRARLASIDQQIAAMRSHLNELPNSGVEIGALRLERDSAQSAYQTLTDRLNTNLASQAEAASLGSVVVVDRVLRADPKGNVKFLLPLAALTVIVLAFSVPFLLDLVDPRLVSVEQLEALYQAPVLAALTASQ